MDESYFWYSCRLKPGTLLKIRLLLGCLSHFLKRAIVSNCLKRLRKTYAGHTEGVF